MSYERLAYDDADTAGQMHDDCAACGTRIALPRQRTTAHRRRAVTMPAPSLLADDSPSRPRSPRSRSATRRRTWPHGCTCTWTDLQKTQPTTRARGGTPSGCRLSLCVQAAVAQWKESPQAQEPVAFGLSIVKPCFSIESTKSMLAPLR